MGTTVYAHLVALITLLGAGALLAFVPDSQVPHALLTGYIGTVLGAYFGPAGTPPPGAPAGGGK
jgi:hypothetical protein